jgi:hypothetical protein
VERREYRWQRYLTAELGTAIVGSATHRQTFYNLIQHYCVSCPVFQYQESVANQTTTLSVVKF